MSPHDRAFRRKLKALAQAGALASALTFGVSLWAVGAQAAPVAGTAQVSHPAGSANAGQAVTSGGSQTEWTLTLPAGAACAGDSANGGYRVQSYMVPSSVDPATLTFDADGPVPNGLSPFRQPLYDTGSAPFVNAQTANAATAGGPGPVINIATFSFEVYAGGDITPGTYNVGIACTLGTPSATQLDRYWNVQMTFTADAADTPAGIAWTAQAPPATTTTTTTAAPTTTTTAAVTTTSTTASTTTSLTTAPTTSTTALSSSTTTSSVVGSVSSTTSTSAGEAVPLVLGDSGSPTGGGPAQLATLPRTGASTTVLAVSGLLLLVFGRMAVLLGRAPETSVVWTA